MMKKGLFSLLGILITIVGVMIVWDRTTIKEDATAGKNGVMILNGRVGIVETKVEAVEKDVVELKQGQARIEKRVVDGQQKILETLYTLPSKRRQQEMPVLEKPSE